MIIETRVFNRETGRMVYFDPIQPNRAGIVAALPAGAINGVQPVMIPLMPTDPVMMKTSIMDMENKRLWEADICECQVETSFGLIKEMGIIVWSGAMGSFTLEIGKDYEGKGTIKIQEVRQVGNMYEHPHLFKRAKAITKIENVKKS